MTEHDPGDHDNPLQGYFDWQVTTLMLARDLSEPVSATDEAAQHQRRHDTENLVRELTLGVLPEQYKHDANLAWPPELMMQITRETLRKATNLAGI
ncbi:hypothetical protein OT109_00130 [Phycisphaeraceae bacterium D3-23]